MQYSETDVVPAIRMVCGWDVFTMAGRHDNLGISKHKSPLSHTRGIISLFHTWVNDALALQQIGQSICIRFENCKDYLDPLSC